MIWSSNLITLKLCLEQGPLCNGNLFKDLLPFDFKGGKSFASSNNITAIKEGSDTEREQSKALKDQFPFLCRLKISQRH